MRCFPMGSDAQALLKTGASEGEFHYDPGETQQEEVQADRTHQQHTETCGFF